MKFMKCLMFSGLIAGFLIGCGGETPEPEAPEVPPAEPPAAAPEPAPEPLATATATATPEPPPPPAPEPLTDEQIAMVTDSANNAEVEQAKLAQKKAKHPRVKKFAATMIAHHNQAKAKQAKIVKKAQITPAESSLSTQLTTDNTSTLETLKTAEAADFDKLYIQSQVDAHQKVLQAFDSQLIPNAKNEELKAALEEFRPKIEQHLTEAQEIQTVLAAAASDTGTGAGTSSGATKGASGGASASAGKASAGASASGSAGSAAASTTGGASAGSASKGAGSMGGGKADAGAK